MLKVPCIEQGELNCQVTPCMLFVNFLKLHDTLTQWACRRFLCARVDWCFYASCCLVPSPSEAAHTQRVVQQIVSQYRLPLPWWQHDQYCHYAQSWHRTDISVWRWVCCGVWSVKYVCMRLHMDKENLKGDMLLVGYSFIIWNCISFRSYWH
jgi:hypothetical protein